MTSDLQRQAESNDWGAAPVLLLVEDCPGDADLVRENLDIAGNAHYDIRHVHRLVDAERVLSTTTVDVVLLDLGLPDGNGVENVRRLRNLTSVAPIVVLTGNEDERIALACIDAGAQDYLCKGEVRPVALRRAIGYAITRLRESQLRELQEMFDRYRELSQSPPIALASTAGPAARVPDDVFRALVERYEQLLNPYLEKLVLKVEAPRLAMDAITDDLGEAGGGPRDLLDIHLAALGRIATQGSPAARSLVVEARLLALEMMGLLVDFYRLGNGRRRSGEFSR